MRKLIIGCIVIAILALAVFFIATREQTPRDEKTIRIGVILPLSGNMELYGKQIKEGIEFYKKQHPPTPEKPYEIIYEDDQMMPAKTASAAKKLIHVDKVDWLGTGLSMQSFVVGPMVENTNTRHISYSSDTNFTKYKNNYDITVNIQDDVRVMLDEIQRRGYKRIAMLSANEVFADLVEITVKDLIKEYEMELVFNSKIMLGVRNFRIDIAKAEMMKPDIYILQTWSPELEIVMRQLREKTNTPITTIVSFFLSLMPELFEGQFGTASYVQDEKFLNDFYEMFQKYPAQLQAFSYTMMSMIMNAEKGDLDLDEYVKKNGMSVFGPLRAVDSKIAHYPSVIKEIRNGKPVVIQE